MPATVTPINAAQVSVANSVQAPQPGKRPGPGRPPVLETLSEANRPAYLALQAEAEQYEARAKETRAKMRQLAESDRGAKAEREEDAILAELQKKMAAIMAAKEARKASAAK